MEIKNVHLFFEQSGTFKNEFKKLGFCAYYYDIPPKEIKTIRKSDRSKKQGVCSEERSMISKDYARNFICDYIIGKTQNYYLIPLLKL